MTAVLVYAHTSSSTDSRVRKLAELQSIKRIQVSRSREHIIPPSRWRFVPKPIVRRSTVIESSESPPETMCVICGKTVRSRIRRDGAEIGLAGNAGEWERGTGNKMRRRLKHGSTLHDWSHSSVRLIQLSASQVKMTFFFQHEAVSLLLQMLECLGVLEQ